MWQSIARVVAACSLAALATAVATTVDPQSELVSPAKSHSSAVRHVPAPPAASAYKVSAWSGWRRAEGVQYRYRWGWNPQESRYATQVDAVFEMRNLQARAWNGAARSLDCSVETVSMGRDVVLRPIETRTVTFLTPNCGTKFNPSFRPNVVRSQRIDH